MPYPVFLNVYDLSSINYYLHFFGIGAYHTTIHILGDELSFGQSQNSNSGVYIENEYATLQNPNYIFRETILMGNCEKTKKEIQSIIDDMIIQYRGDEYDLILNNCNHFSNDLCQRLLDTSIPKWINRLAGYGGIVSCIIPKDLRNQTAHQSKMNTPQTKSLDGKQQFQGFAVLVGEN